jgi:hypothetical protein
MASVITQNIIYTPRESTFFISPSEDASALETLNVSVDELAERLFQFKV